MSEADHIRRLLEAMQRSPNPIAVGHLLEALALHTIKDIESRSTSAFSGPPSTWLIGRNG